jgi:hypothetical protein
MVVGLDNGTYRERKRKSVGLAWAVWKNKKKKEKVVTACSGQLRDVKES